MFESIFMVPDSSTKVVIHGDDGLQCEKIVEGPGNCDALWMVTKLNLLKLKFFFCPFFGETKRI